MEGKMGHQLAHQLAKEMGCDWVQKLVEQSEKWLVSGWAEYNVERTMLTFLEKISSSNWEKK